MFDWKDLRTGLLLAFICSLGGLIWTANVKYVENISFHDAWEAVLNVKVPLFYAVVIVLVCIVFTYKIAHSKNKSKFSKSEDSRRKQLQNFNSIEDIQSQILVKWIVYFYNNGRPVVSDIDIYCTNHPPIPMKFLGRRCPVNGCRNNEDEINYRAI